MPPVPRCVYSTYLGGSDDTVAQGIAAGCLGAGACHRLHEGDRLSDHRRCRAADAGQPASASADCAPMPSSPSSAPTEPASRTRPICSATSTIAGVGIAVDGTGHAYVVGTTDSSTFPIVQAFHHREPGNLGLDAFVTKLDPSGSRSCTPRIWAASRQRHVGCEGEEEGLAIAVDSSGNAYVSGYHQLVQLSDDGRCLPAGVGGRILRLSRLSVRRCLRHEDRGRRAGRDARAARERESGERAAAARSRRAGPVFPVRQWRRPVAAIPARIDVPRVRGVVAHHGRRERT